MVPGLVSQQLRHKPWHKYPLWDCRRHFVLAEAPPNKDFQEALGSFSAEDRHPRPAPLVLDSFLAGAECSARFSPPTVFVRANSALLQSCR